MATIEQAKAAMAQAGLGVVDIAAGTAYAERVGYTDAEGFFSCAMAAILYDAAQLEACEWHQEWYPVEVGSLDDVVVSE